MNAATLWLAVLAVAVGCAIWIRRDYQGWIALGKGGLPSNLQGWMVTTRFRLMKRDPIETAMYAADIARPGAVAFLGELPRRNGPRPSIAPWPIPHRQLSQFVGSSVRQDLDAVFEEMVRRHGDKVHFKLSFFEKHNPAVTVRDPGCGHDHAKLCEGETAHIHPGDGSMHMVFSPRDAKTVLEAGWGERHPMAGVLPELPHTYVYVYPPRDSVELAIVGQLLEAAIAYMAASGQATKSERVA